MLAVLQSYRGDCDAVTSFLQKGIDRAISNCMDSPALHQVHGSLAVQVLRVILFAILISVDTTLRGISQVFLCNNPISGIFIFVGLCISTDVQLGPLALLGSFAGFCGGMTALLVHMLATSDQAPANDEPPAAQQLYVDDEANMDLLSGNISASSPPAAATPVESPQPAQRYLFSPFSDALHNGLYGYDGALVACGTRVFLSTLLVEVSASASDNTVAGDLGIVYAVGALLGFICGAARGGISRGINKAFGLPTLTLTFNMVILLSLYALGGPSSAFLDTKQTVVTAASSASSASAESQLASVSCCLSASSLCNRSALPIPNAVEETEIAFESFTNALIQARCSALRGGTIISEGWVMGASSATTVLPALAAASATASPLLFDDTDPALLDISSGDWAKAIVLGVSQFMFVDTLEGGILVLIGILFATATGCALAVLGSIVSLLSATFLIKLSYRKTSWFASRASLAAATVSESPLKLQSSSVKVFASSICPTQSIGAPSEFSTICIPIAKASVFSVSASPVTSKSVPWTVPVGSVRNGLAGYNGGGTMACLGSAAVGYLMKWRASRIARTTSGTRQPRKICVRKQVSVMPAPDPVHIQHTDIAIVTSSENEDQPRHSPPQAPILMPPPMKSDPTELPSELLVCHEHDIIMFHIGFAVVTLCALIYCCAAVFVTSIFFAALPNVLPLAAPVMTLPFVLTTYIFMTPLVK